MINKRFSQFTSDERKRFNAKLIGILNKIMSICEENNIRWFVGYGGCIGAIRHKGCIPWDDDIDVCIPRPDYDRFVEVLDEFKKFYNLEDYSRKELDMYLWQIGKKYFARF